MSASLDSRLASATLPEIAPDPAASQARMDNLSIMLFVAALFHAIVILGVSFTVPTPG